MSYNDILYKEHTQYSTITINGVLVCVCVKSLQPHLTVLLYGLQPIRSLCPWDSLQAKILEWISMPSCREFS